MKLKSFIYTISLACAAFTANGQAPHSSYFMENMPTKHALNPALTPDFNYVSMPALGGIQIGVNSNVGLGTFLYPVGNEMVTALNQSVSSEEFLSKLRDNNIVENDMRIGILSCGFKGIGGYNTIEISARSITGVYLPYELFEFAKIGQLDAPNTTYDIQDINVRSHNFAELAFGHSHNITDKITVGAKLKLLVGIVSAEAEIERLNVHMSKDKWVVKENGRTFLTPGLQVKYKDNGEIDDFDTGTFGADGMGFGIDLGVSWKLLNNLRLSASITDLGFISWKGAEALVNPAPFEFDGFHHFGSEKDPVTGESPLSQETDQIKEDLRSLIRFENNVDAKSMQKLATTINVAAEYSILKNKISFGLLSSTRVGMPHVWTELMATANFRPAKWFHATVNGSVSNVAQSVGLMLNFCPKGFNFFIGSDYIPFKYSKEGIPLNRAKVNLALGMNFTFNHGSKK